MEAHILVVDDDAAIRDTIALFLSGEGYHVHTAWNGSIALAIQSRNPTDLVLSDVMMPQLDGLGMVQALRATGDPTPVILMSAAGAVTCGLPRVFCLGKPFDLDYLLALITELLRQA